MGTLAMRVLSCERYLQGLNTSVWKRACTLDKDKISLDHFTKGAHKNYKRFETRLL